MCSPRWVTKIGSAAWSRPRPGNHAQGIAYHARLLGIAATIVMPADTPFTKVANTAHHGARIELVGADYATAFAHAQALADETGARLVPAFDDPLIIAGQGTVAIEVLAAAPDVDTIVVPVGVADSSRASRWLRSTSRPTCALSVCRARDIPECCTRCSEGRSRRVGRRSPKASRWWNPACSPAIVGALVDDIVVAAEQHIEEAIALFVEIEKSVVEGAGAAALAAVLQYPEMFHGRRVALIASGGNIDASVLTSVLTRALARSGRLVRLLIEVPDRPGVLAAIAEVVAHEAGQYRRRRASTRPPGRRAQRARGSSSPSRPGTGPHAETIVAALVAIGFHVELAA